MKILFFILIISLIISGYFIFNPSSIYIFKNFLFFPKIKLQIQENIKTGTEKISTLKEIKNGSKLIANNFNPQEIKWIKKNSYSPWGPRDSGEIFVFQNKIWLIGGLNGEKQTQNGITKYWKAQHFNDIWNTEDGINWKLVSQSSNWPPKRSMSVFYFNDKLWMLGGWSPITGYKSDVWTSKDGIEWKKEVEEASFEPVEGQSVVVFKNKIWKIGGVNYDQRKAKNDVWYSENGIDWIKVKNIPWEPRWDHAFAVFKDKLFLTGGMNLEGKIFNDVWVSEDGFSWNLVTSTAPWPARQGHSMQVYKRKLWIIGGLTNQKNKNLADVWFSDDGIIWQKSNDAPWTEREDFFSIVFDDKIWVLGGMDKNYKWLNDVWASTFQ